MWECGEIGRHDGLKIRCCKRRGGSSPPVPIKIYYHEISIVLENNSKISYYDSIENLAFRIPLEIKIRRTKSFKLNWFTINVNKLLVYNIQVFE